VFIGRSTRIRESFDAFDPPRSSCFGPIPGKSCGDERVLRVCANATLSPHGPVLVWVRRRAAPDDLSVRSRAAQPGGWCWPDSLDAHGAKPADLPGSRESAGRRRRGPGRGTIFRRPVGGACPGRGAAAGPARTSFSALLRRERGRAAIATPPGRQGVGERARWGWALRKKFLPNFDFELQAAASNDAVLLSLGPQPRSPEDGPAFLPLPHVPDVSLPGVLRPMFHRPLAMEPAPRRLPCCGQAGAA